MQHLLEFEIFDPLYEDEVSFRTALKNLDFYIKQNPAGKKVAEDCKTLLKAMKGMGTDEDAIYGVFNSIKTKDEMNRLLVLWDTLGCNYESSAQNYFVSIAKAWSSTFQHFPKFMKDVILNMKFWDKPQQTEMDKYLKAKEEWYKKNPQARATSLSYWLKEELDAKELAKVNAIVKKFGIKFG